VFTARYALSPYVKQIRFVFKGLSCKEQQRNVVVNVRLGRRISTEYSNCYINVPHSENNELSYNEATERMPMDGVDNGKVCQNQYDSFNFILYFQCTWPLYFTFLRSLCMWTNFNIGYFFAFVGIIFVLRRSQWPRSLRRESAAERLLELWVRIQQRA
jgi:hypothetical protein